MKHFKTIDTLISHLSAENNGIIYTIFGARDKLRLRADYPDCTRLIFTFEKTEGYTVASFTGTELTNGMAATAFKKLHA